MVLQVELADLVKEGAILALPLQGVHLLFVHDALVSHIQAHHADVWGLSQDEIGCFCVPNNVCLCTGIDIAIAEERSSQNDQLLLQHRQQVAAQYRQTDTLYGIQLQRHMYWL